jgi:hypothetical protein
LTEKKKEFIVKEKNVQKEKAVDMDGYIAVFVLWQDFMKPMN